MNVAGKTDDELKPGEELLVDDGEAMGPTEGDGDYGNDKVMNGPVYPEGPSTYPESRVLMRLGDLRSILSEVIKKSGSKYVLYAKHKKGGKRRKLGTHSSKASAERQERAIHANGG